MVQTFTPLLDIRVDWRNESSVSTYQMNFNDEVNDGFELSATNYNVTASAFNSGATSITATATGAYMDSWEGTLVTLGVTGSGLWSAVGFTPARHKSGRTYRFRIALKSSAGSLAWKIGIGSQGTPADFAEATLAVTTSWALYSVDWTPSADRTDTRIFLKVNAATVSTIRLDMVEVYEVLTDVSDRVDALTYGRGANFDGSAESPGTATLRLRNDDGRFTPDNASSPLTGDLRIGRGIWIRASLDGIWYGLFTGVIRRIVPLPETRMVELLCEDMLRLLANAEVSVIASLDRAFADFRGDVLDEIGEPATRRSLSAGVENDIGYTAADQQSALAVLSDVNKSTGSIHVVIPHPSSSVLYRYTTLDRTRLQTGAPLFVLSDTVAGLDGYDVTDEALVNFQRVALTPRTLEPPAIVWTSETVPFTVPGSGSVTLWVNFDQPVFDTTLQTGSVGSVTPVLTPFGDSVKIVISGTGADATVTSITVTGRALTSGERVSATAENGASKIEYGLHAGSEVDSPYLLTTAHAQGLADWTVSRYKDPKPRPSVTVENHLMPNQILREVGQRTALTFALLSLVSKEFLIRSLSTTVQQGGLLWITTYDLEEAPTSDLFLFTLDTAGKGLDDAGAGTEGRLAA